MSGFVQMPLAEVCTIVGGGTPRRSNAAYFDGAIPWATPTDVTSLDSLFIDQTKEAITEVGLKESSARLVPAGTVLMTSRATIGYTAIATRPMATNQGFANLICGERVEPEFLAYWLRDQRERLIQLAGGTTFRELPKSTLKKVHIPLPSLDEQRRIVGILNRVARIERLRTLAKERLRQFVPALFVKMFGDPIENPKQWPICTLREISTLGPQYGANARAAQFSDGRPRYIRITDIQDGGSLSSKPVGVEIDDWERYKLRKGDILFARSGATVGKTYIHQPEGGRFAFAGYLIRFRLNESMLHPQVAFAFTQTKAYARWVKSKQRTAAQPNINGQEYADLKILLPPLDEQQRFVEIIQTIQSLAPLVRAGSITGSNLSASIMSRLLRSGR